MANLFFLFVTFLVSLAITGVIVFLTIPFFVFFILNTYSNITFRQLVEIEEDELFHTQKPQAWSRFNHPPELKDYTENVETQQPTVEEKIHE